MADNLDLLSSKFVFENTDLYSLSIRHQLDGYSFSVKNQNGIVVAVKHVVCNKNYDLHDEPLFQLNYRNISYIECGSFSFIPDSIFSEDSCKLFLPIEKDKLTLSNVRYCTPSSALSDKVNVAFVLNDKLLPAPIKQRLSDNKPVVFLHEMSLIADMAMSVEERLFVLCEVSSSVLDVVVVKDAKILMATSYSVCTELDVLYYIMEVYRALNLDSENVKLFLSGDLVAFPVVDVIKNYIRYHNVIYPENISDDITIPHSEYFSLISKSM